MPLLAHPLIGFGFFILLPVLSFLLIRLIASIVFDFIFWGSNIDKPKNSIEQTTINNYYTENHLHVNNDDFDSLIK